ncbi:M48 family metalloprotease [Piscinibacter sp. Jin2]|uniref:M48 family metalloprotease n=1 Tax=Aquariibacter lacus TaxID=2801332 RepID=A0A9X1BMQ2_9BURK|nr:M48 family metalloprotease [Piscinibacter lacus]
MDLRPALIALLSLGLAAGPAPAQGLPAFAEPVPWPAPLQGLADAHAGHVHGVSTGGTLALLAALSAPLPGERPQLPSLGDGGAESIPIGTERRLGDRIMRDIWRDPAYLDDPVLNDYLRALWQPLFDSARRRGEVAGEAGERFAWRTFLVQDPSVNAFALPGGYVGIHLGLIAVTASADELASVLAHEMSHVTQRHIARSVASNQSRSILAVATLILGVLAASRSADAANALIAGGQAVAVQGQLNYSRDMEREADRIGHGVLTGAGFDPAGMASMFEKLLQAARLNDSQNFPYLRTHPLSTERIGEARSRLGLDLSGRSTPPRSLLHALMQARARVLMDPRALSLQRWQALDATLSRETAAPLPERLGQAYASALASLRLRDWPRAERPLREARALAAGDAAALRAVELLDIELQTARGDAAAAAGRLEAALATPRAPAGTGVDTQFAAAGGRVWLFAEVEQALLPGAAPQSLRPLADRLQTWVAERPEDGPAWALLGRVWERLGEGMRSLRAAAEARAAQADLQGAIDRLKAAQQRGVRGDFIEASVIDARLRELQARRQLELADERNSAF